jgi:hypothetical protein
MERILATNHDYENLPFPFVICCNPLDVFLHGETKLKTPKAFAAGPGQKINW